MPRTIRQRCTTCRECDDIAVLLAVMSRDRNTARGVITRLMTLASYREHPLWDKPVKGDTGSICAMSLLLLLIAMFGSIAKVRPMLVIALMVHFMQQPRCCILYSHSSCAVADIMLPQSLVDCCSHYNRASHNVTLHF